MSKITILLLWTAEVSGLWRCKANIYSQVLVGPLCTWWKTDVSVPKRSIIFLVVWTWRGCKTESQVPLIGNLPPWTWVGSRQGVLCWCPMKRKGGASTHVVQRPPWSPRFTQVGGGVKRYEQGPQGIVSCNDPAPLQLFGLMQLCISFGY